MRHGHGHRQIEVNIQVLSQSRLKVIDSRSQIFLKKHYDDFHGEAFRGLVVSFMNFILNLY